MTGREQVKPVPPLVLLHALTIARNQPVFETHLKAIDREKRLR
jgi:hypothetical protein